MKKVRLIVSGRVQGVGFRYSTYAIALQIGDIYGRVWNNDDVTVEIIAQSQDAAKMAKFLKENNIEIDKFYSSPGLGAL